MIAVALFLTSFSTIATLIVGWLVGVTLIVALFLYNRNRIKSHDHEL